MFPRVGLRVGVWEGLVVGDKRRSSRERHILTRWRLDTGLSTNWAPVRWEAERILLVPPDTHTGIMVFIGTSLKSVVKYFKRKGKTFALFQVQLGITCVVNFD